MMKVSIKNAKEAEIIIMKEEFLEIFFWIAVKILSHIIKIGRAAKQTA